jgi:tetratricopeptide (TPR) repeat protein
MGSLPLALAQAGSYMGATQTSPADYLIQYKAQRRVLLEKKPPRALWTYEESVFTTWEISFLSIERRLPSAAKFLLICSYSEPENIPYLLFQLGAAVEGRRASIWQSLGSMPASKWKRTVKRVLSLVGTMDLPQVLTGIKWLTDLMVDSESFRAAIYLLIDYSFITENEKKDGIIIHPLIHTWCYHRVVADRTAILLDAIYLAGRAVDWDLEKPNTWMTVRDFQEHISKCANIISAVDSKSLDKTDELNLPHALEVIGVFLGHIEHHDEAINICRLNYRLCVPILGPLHPLTLATLDYLARALESARKFVEVEVCRRELLDTAERALGKDNQDVWHYLQNLGKLLLDQCKFLEAKVILEKVIALWRSTGNDEQMAAPMINLATILIDQGDLSKAEALLTSVGRKLARCPNSNIPLRLHAIGWLGKIDSLRGQHGEHAEKILLGINIAEEEYGPEDPLTLRWYFRLLDHYSNHPGPVDGQRRTEIITLGEDLVKKWTRIQGETDRHSSEVFIILSTFFWLQGDFDMSKDYLQRSLDILQMDADSILSREDQRILISLMDSLAILYWDRGLVEEAICHLMQSMELCKSIAEPGNNRDVECDRRIRSNIAMAYRDSGRLSEAEDILRQVVQERVENSTPDIGVLDRNNLATICHMRGRHDESLQLFTEVLAMVGASPRDEKEPLLVKHNLACLHESMGNHAEAIRLLEGVLNHKELLMGFRSPATVKTALTLARMYRQQQSLVKVADLEKRIRPYLEYA